MDRSEALKLLNTKLDDYRKHSYAEVAAKIIDSEGKTRSIEDIEVQLCSAEGKQIVLPCGPAIWGSRGSPRPTRLTATPPASRR
jgi:hypothetical protein